MNFKESMSNTITSIKKNTSLFGYICSKYILEIIASMVIIISYLAMFLSYGLMTISNKIYLFINITYDDFGEYELEKFVDSAVKTFYTKFPVMKKYFVNIKVKKEKVKIEKEPYDVIDLTNEDDEHQEKEVEKKNN